jgi:hypothetical protein
MKKQFLVITLVLVSAFGCTKKSTDEETPNADATAAAGAPAHAAKEEKKCKNGSTPQILKGTCSGTWAYDEAAKICNFNWGPKQECPKGKTSISLPAYCYGTTAIPTAGEHITTAEACEKHFGTPPKSKMEIAGYELQCCD